MSSRTVRRHKISPKSPITKNAYTNQGSMPRIASKECLSSYTDQGIHLEIMYAINGAP
jgi:hypothetical protein